MVQSTFSWAAPQAPLPVSPNSNWEQLWAKVDGVSPKTVDLVLLASGASRTMCKKDPVHCQWNDWKIGKCSAKCGEGMRTDTRTKKVHEKDGGTCSGPSKRSVHCKEKECPVHCEWNDWVE